MGQSLFGTDPLGWIIDQQFLKEMSFSLHENVLIQVIDWHSLFFNLGITTIYIKEFHGLNKALKI